MPKKLPKNKYTESVGKRKSAIARVRIYDIGKTGFLSIFSNKLKSGDVLVNKKPASKVFHSEVLRNILMKPLFITSTQDIYGVTVNIKGGGHKGQVEAISQGISKALLLIDEKKFRPMLKPEGLLTRDPRVKERRKVGTGGKARRKKQSPKR